MIKKVFTVEMRAPFIAGLFLCGILAAIMSTADSQLLVSASSVAEDIFKGLLKKDADDKTVMNVSRVTVLVVAVLATSSHGIRTTPSWDWYPTRGQV